MVRALPGGTVTFLFSDIEGSTRLLRELGAERYAAELAEHRRLLREAFTRCGGIEVDTQGDAFFYAFDEANAALEAAEQVQAALIERPTRVRIGIHTGQPLLTAEGYVGIDVHHGARVMSAAHGGQVLVSEAARLAAGRELRSLGTHRLKDLTAPEPLWQLGEGDFPPPSSLNQTNLPIQPWPLIGRKRELAEAGELLREHRIVTLVGAGGSGKTRLALQLAAEAVDDYPHGVWWVPLQALRDPALVIPTIAATVGATEDLVDHIGGKRLLLLLDNMEQLVHAAGDLAGLIRNSGELKLLVTSRAPLQIAGEAEYLLEPLVDDDAAALFIERAAVGEPVDAVREVCRRLDCLPLAIELAAARTKLLPPDRLLERLEQRLPLLTGGRRDAPERQQTLRATIEWSHDLLTQDEQQLFARLAVFAGSFDVDAAEQICDAELDLLQSLVDKSLVRSWSSGRLGMLETIHEYASERLAASEGEESLRRRHAEWFTGIAEQLAPRLWDAEHVATVERYDSDHANLRAALAWSVGADAGLAMRLAAPAAEYWLIRGFFEEGREWLERVLATAVEAAPSLRAKVLTGASLLAYEQGDTGRARTAAEQAVMLARAGDHTGTTIHALNRLANACAAEAGMAEAIELLEEAVELATRHGLHRWLAISLVNLGGVRRRLGDRYEARAAFQDALAEFAAIGNQAGRAAALLELGEIAGEEGSFGEAHRLLRQSLEIACSLRREHRIALCLEGFARIAARQGNPERAVQLLAAGDALRRQVGARRLATGPESLPAGFADARDELGELGVANAWALGASLTGDEAVEYALERAVV